MMRRAFFIVLTITFLTGCTSMKPEDFAGKEPRFQIESYFEGRTKAWGIFQDRFGKLRRQFQVEIEGTWDGKLLTLVEDFVYDDGEREQRIWRIRKTGEHAYEGEADGVIGTAKGRAYGNALNWRYDFDLKVGDSSWRVTFDDWLFLMEDGIVINRAEVTKFGIQIGEVTLFFRKPTTAQEASAKSPTAPIARN